MLVTQVSPYVLVGPLADLPDPAAVSQGYLFRATDTGDCLILLIDAATGVRSWEPLFARVPMLFAFATGRVSGQGDTPTRYMANESPDDTTASVLEGGSAFPIGYVLPYKSISQIFSYNVIFNSITQPMTLSIYKNAVVVQSFTIRPGDSGPVSTVLALPFAAGDRIDVGTTFSDLEVGVVGLAISATLEMT